MDIKEYRQQQLACNEAFQTSDLGIAAYLLTIGFCLLYSTCLNNKKLTFTFERRVNTEEIIINYLNGLGVASAKDLFSNYRILRALALSQTYTGNK